MDHARVKESFSEFWEKGLDDATRKEVEAHLEGCAACRAEYQQFQQTMAPLGKLHRVAAPDMIGSVPALIHKRSRGRFFGKKGGAGQFPLEWISLIMLGVIAAVYLVVKLAQPALRLR